MFIIAQASSYHTINVETSLDVRFGAKSRIPSRIIKNSVRNTTKIADCKPEQRYGYNFHWPVTPSSGLPPSFRSSADLPVPKPLALLFRSLATWGNALSLFSVRREALALQDLIWFKGLDLRWVFVLNWELYTLMSCIPCLNCISAHFEKHLFKRYTCCLLRQPCPKFSKPRRPSSRPSPQGNISRFW